MWHEVSEGIREIGWSKEAFAFDNERPHHREFVPAFAIASRVVTNGDFLEFIMDAGYTRPELWLSDAWRLVQEERLKAPLYWREDGDRWLQMTLAGERPVRLEEPVCHVSFYEADAYARWAGARLPTEAEWETMAAKTSIRGNFLESGHFHPVPLGLATTVAASKNGHAAEAGSHEIPEQLFGDVWEWTQTPYRPYPGYRPPAGALGEYNAKFMCNQMVLRGGSCATPVSHIRATYRNFFPPDARWQFAGFRLAKDLEAMS
jgi:ergothioneine biosynthesis protein EgtB